MGAIAEYENNDGNMVNDGLTFLDLVKHACKAVMFSLNDDDRFSLVVFGTTAKTVFPLVKMTEANR